jgi:hypothetical protein
MAHFARLNENNLVIQVVVIANDVPTSNGPLGENNMHLDGEQYCRTLFKTNAVYKQTSYNGSFRKKYAGIGHTYNSDADIFVAPRPFDSWILDNNFDWQPPVAKPTTLEIDGKPVFLSWDEPNIQWLGNVNEGTEENQSWVFYTWDNNSFTWVDKQPLISG